MIKGDTVRIDKTAKIHKSAIIKGDEITIEGNVEIGKDFSCICARKLHIKRNTVIKDSFKALCRELTIGEHNYVLEGVWIEGSLNSINTIVEIGDRNLICQSTRINCNEKVKIGSNVGIGQNVDIWTHGSFMDVLEGYPYICAPVTIGNNVWVLARSTVLPGVRIGNDVVIGNNSVVNRDVPDGAFCAGIPAKIVRENEYPKKLSQSEKDTIMINIVEDYKKLPKLKGFDAVIAYKESVINFKVRGLEGEAIFDTRTRTISGMNNEYVEDFRDYLRHRGVKFFTNKPFRMIVPSDFKKWLGD
jgi:acetyltransferase-like isoleucine patch superfamily enzyme